MPEGNDSITVIPSQNDAEKFKSVSVEKLIELELDLGTLLALDLNDLNTRELKKAKDKYLQELARDNTQLLLSSVWSLKAERVEDAVVVRLPEPTTRLPREKPLPKPRPLTRWQQYAKEKGITSSRKKKGNLTWDEVLKKWVPRHGFKKAEAEREKNWVIEIPQQADPYVDYFEKKKEEKKEKVAKNEYQRLRNIAKARNVKVPAMGLPPTENLTSLQLNSAAKIANVSTASLGRFQERLSTEKTLKNASVLTKRKRKLPQLTQNEERSSNMELAKSLLNKKPKLEIQKAANREIHTEQLERSKKKKSAPKKRRTEGGGGKKKKRYNGGQGKRVFKTSGGKRR